MEPSSHTNCSRAYRLKVCTTWLPPGGSCQTALRNRLTDEGRRTVGQEMQLDEMRGVCSRLYHSTEKSKTFSCRCPSSVMVNNRFRSADYLPRQLFNFGMIATGNHNFERFAALCNTPGGSQGVVVGGVFHSTDGSVAEVSGGYDPPLLERIS